MRIEFHHVGYATKSIASSVRIFESLGYTLEGPLVHDFELGVKVQFMKISDGGSSRIELLEDLRESATHPILEILNQRSGCYHLAYLVNSIQEYWRKSHLRPLSKCKPAVAFAGRHIRFFMSRDGGIIELIANSQNCDCVDGK